jgi:hypothetical protein
VPQVIMVVEILVAQSHSVDSLRDVMRKRALDELGGAMIGEASANCWMIPMSASVLRSSRLLPSDKMSPLSNAATTWREPRTWKSR